MADRTFAVQAGHPRIAAMNSAVLLRLIRISVSLLAGLLLCVSFPPTGWWWAAVPALALFTWVLVNPKTTLAGGFGYGLLFGLAFYLPLLPWISGLVGAGPWMALSLLEALFPAMFGLFVVAAAFTLLATLGEKALGLNLRAFIDQVEAEAAKGNVWPGIVCFVGAPATVLCLVLWLGLR